MDSVVSDLQNAVKAIQTALDAVTNAVPTEDVVWTAVQSALTTNGWTPPALPEAETPAEDASETSEEPTA